MTHPGLLRLSRGLGRIEDALAGLVLAIVLAIVLNELVSRGLFGWSYLWTDELSRLLLVVMTYIGAISLTRDGAHVRVEFLVQMGPPWLQALADRFADVACLVFSLAATWLGILYVHESMVLDISFAHSNLPFPIWVAQLIVPVAFGFMSVRLLLRLFGVRPDHPVGSVEA